MRITKEHYLQPFTQVLSLETMRETLSFSSPVGSGNNLDPASETGGDWDDLFD